MSEHINIFQIMPINHPLHLLEPDPGESAHNTAGYKLL